MKKIAQMMVGLSLLLLLVLLVTSCERNTIKSLLGKGEVISPEKALPPETTSETTPESKIDFDIEVEREPIAEPENSKKAEPQLDSRLVGLIAKAKEMDNYQYFYEYGTSNNYRTFVTTDSYQAYFKNGKVRKVHSQTVQDQNLFYNEVYLDLNQRTAYGLCNKKTISCAGLRNKAYPVNFEAEKLFITPTEILGEITPEAKVLREEWFDQRRTLVISFPTRDSKTEYLYLDSFSGFPLKRIISKWENGEEKMLSQITFTGLAVGSLEEKEVTLPSAYEKVEEI